jgi:hypothetical protein
MSEKVYIGLLFGLSALWIAIVYGVTYWLA